MDSYIVTGGSRGLGLAIVKSVLDRGGLVISVSRKKSEELKILKSRFNERLSIVEGDLSDIGILEPLVDNVLNRVDMDSSSITLINNAGTITPSLPIEECNLNDISKAYNLNCVSPMVLTSKFIANFKDLSIKKTIVNISSGAGKKPYSSWSIYCGTKAALDLFTESVGVEQSGVVNETKIFSFAPGVVDTDMQSDIRSFTKEQFPNVERFKTMKSEDQLLKPSFVANRLLDIVEQDSFDNGEICDIRSK